jgi:hypothetical protein
MHETLDLTFNTLKILSKTSLAIESEQRNMVIILSFHHVNKRIIETMQG